MSEQTSASAWETVKTLEKRVAELERVVGAIKAIFVSGGKPGAVEIADDADLDSKWGDEDIKRDPSAKYWPGEETFVGRTMSQCSPQYLDAYARYRDACAFMNEKSGDEAKAKYIKYDRKSAARARGWAARLRARGVAPRQAVPSGPGRMPNSIGDKGDAYEPPLDGPDVVDDGIGF